MWLTLINKVMKDMPDVLTSMKQEGIFCQQDIVQKSGICLSLALTENVWQ